MSTPTEEISDGYHTFGELYEHRHMLFIALTREWPSMSWRSRLHEDGTMFDGFFIAGMRLPTGDISYHLPLRLWPLMGHVGEYKAAHKWDGHTANDVIARLEKWVKS